MTAIQELEEYLSQEKGNGLISVNLQVNKITCIEDLAAEILRAIKAETVLIEKPL